MQSLATCPITRLLLLPSSVSLVPFRRCYWVPLCPARLRLRLGARVSRRSVSDTTIHPGSRRTEPCDVTPPPGPAGNVAVDADSGIYWICFHPGTPPPGGTSFGVAAGPRLHRGPDKE